MSKIVLMLGLLGASLSVSIIVAGGTAWALSVADCEYMMGHGQSVCKQLNPDIHSKQYQVVWELLGHGERTIGAITWYDGDSAKRPSFGKSHTAQRYQ